MPPLPNVFYRLAVGGLLDDDFLGGPVQERGGLGLRSAPQLAHGRFELGVLVVGAVGDDLRQDEPRDGRAGKNEADGGDAVQHEALL